MIDRVSRVGWAVVLSLLAVGLALPFIGLGERDLWSSHEARAAMDARSVLDPLPGQPAGMPHLDDGRPDFQKPPTFYWVVAAIARLRGVEVDALAVRLPAALSAFGVATAVGLTLALGFGRPLAGAIAALVLVTSIHFPWLARIGRIDMPLTFTVCLAALGFALRRPNPLTPFPKRKGGPDTSLSGSPSPLGVGAGGWGPPRGDLKVEGEPESNLSASPSPFRGGGWGVGSFLLAYLACAAGVLLKGPIGLVLPGAIVAAVLLQRGAWPAVWEGRAWWRLMQELHVVPGLLLVAVIVGPVYLWLEYASGGQFAREFLWYHNVTRGLGGSNLSSHPVWLYVPYFLLYFLPFSPLVLLGLCRVPWRDDAVARFGLAWLVGVLVLLSAAKFKRADYLAPAYPGAAIFLGCLCERWTAGRRGVVLMAALALVGWVGRQSVLLPAEEHYRDYRSFAQVVRESAPRPAEITFFRTEAHALAFHVGRPLGRFVEWEALEARLLRPGIHHVVMPPSVLVESRSRLPGFVLDEVSRNTDATGRHERPLVLVRARLRTPASDHARIPQAAADLPRADQHRPAGP